MRTAFFVVMASIASAYAGMQPPAPVPNSAPAPRLLPVHSPSDLSHMMSVNPDEIPFPREPGSCSPEPPLMVGDSGIRPEAIRGWVENLGSNEYGLREEAEQGLSRSGWDGYVAVREVASTSECAETRSRASRLCGMYTCFRLPLPQNDYPKIYNMCCRYAKGGGEPCNQYELALLCHYYTLKAIREGWENRRDGLRTGEPTWDQSAPSYEREATRLMVRDLLRAGFNPEWVRWYLTDMSARTNYWPPALKRPPEWLAHWVGVQMPIPYP